MKQFLSFSVITIVATLFLAPSGFAEPIGAVTEPQPQLTPPPLMITAYYADHGEPLFVQLHNNSDQVVSLDGWSVRVLAQNDVDEVELDLVELSGWFAPRGHLVIAKEGLVTGADVAYTLDSNTVAFLHQMTAAQIRVMPPEDQLIASVEQTVNQFAPRWAQRNISTATGNYLSTFTTKEVFAELVGGGLYYPSEDVSGLQIVEILANARNCSPSDTALDCNDYIKLYNSTAFPVDLAQYRLRSDSGGLKPTASNTFSLSGVLEPGAYTTIVKRSDSEVLSLTNSGGYVWFEDRYGVASFEPFVSYADAGAASKKGLSWAYDFGTAEWKWMQPAPNAPNYWQPVVVAEPIVTESELADCGPGRERNPATNRCRSVLSASTTLTPCAPGQERNPATNRCRSVASATSTLTPCAPGQERNPATNRCRSVASAAAQLQPCAPGQERNPDTNRCRKVVTATAGSSLPDIQDVESRQAGGGASWYITGALVLAAIGYGVYEWRHEIRERVRLPRIGRRG